MTLATNLFWFRRDLRLQDNHALHQALQSSQKLVCVFIFDSVLLRQLSPESKQFAFMYGCLLSLKAELQQAGSDLLFAHGDPAEELARLAQEMNCGRIFANRDYEPYATARDATVQQRLAQQECRLELHKDQVIFEPEQVLTAQASPYSVFTPYLRKWLQNIQPADVQPFDCQSYLSVLAEVKPSPMPSAQALGFSPGALDKLLILPGRPAALDALNDFSHRLSQYETRRDFPAKNGVSRLSAHLRFGTLSIRECVALAWPSDSSGAACWLKELVWREFYQQFLWHYPETATQSYKTNYRNLKFENSPKLWHAWCSGQTGYPLIDAAIRQLLHSGYMHNRLRMVVASFLVKDLLIDWRKGERFFAQHLVDYDQAANVGGWQWAASTGCDAQPYFRIFNPITQSQKFDPKGDFIRRYIPELDELDAKSIHAPWLAKQLPLSFQLGKQYPMPIVDHQTQRTKALALFEVAAEQR